MYRLIVIGTVLKIVCGCVWDSHVGGQKISARFGVRAEKFYLTFRVPENFAVQRVQRLKRFPVCSTSV